MPSDLEVVSLLCRLRSFLKQSLVETHRLALTGLMLRQQEETAGTSEREEERKREEAGGSRQHPPSSTFVQRLLLRLHLEESCRGDSSGGGSGGGNPHGSPEAIKVLSHLLLARRGGGGVGSAAHAHAPAVWYEKTAACRCCGVSSVREREREQEPRLSSAEIHSSASLPPDTPHASSNSSQEYAFPKRHRRQASHLLGEALRGMLFPTNDRNTEAAGKGGGEVSDNGNGRGLVGAQREEGNNGSRGVPPLLITTAQLAILLQDVLKVIKALGGLTCFCPDLFWHALLWSPCPRNGGMSAKRTNIPTADILSFLSDLAASLQLLYAQDIGEFQKRRDKRLGGGSTTAAGATGQANNSSGSHGSSSNSNSHHSSGSGKSGAGRGGRGTAGLSLSSSKAKGKGASSRGNGLSLASIRSSGGGGGGRGSSAGGGKPPQGTGASRAGSGNGGGGGGSSSISSVAPLPTRSPDDLLEPRVLCQLQTDVFLMRGGLVRDVLMQWFASALSEYHEDLASKPLNYSDSRLECGAESVENDDVSCFRRLSSGSTGGGGGGGGASLSSSRQRSDSNVSREECGEQQGGSHRHRHSNAHGLLLGAVSSAAMIDFMQKVLLVSLGAGHTKVSATATGMVDKLTIMFARENCLLTSSLLTSLIRAMTTIVALEQLHFARVQQGSCKKEDKLLPSPFPHVTLSEAIPCGLSFQHSFSANNSAAEAVFRGHNEQKELEKEAATASAHVTATATAAATAAVYNCAPLIASGFDVVEKLIRQALQTSYRHSATSSRQGVSASGLLIDSIEVRCALCFLCYLILLVIH